MEEREERKREKEERERQKQEKKKLDELARTICPDGLCSKCDPVKSPKSSLPKGHKFWVLFPVVSGCIIKDVDEESREEEHRTDVGINKDVDEESTAEEHISDIAMKSTGTQCSNVGARSDVSSQTRSDVRQSTAGPKVKIGVLDWTPFSLRRTPGQHELKQNQPQNIV